MRKILMVTALFFLAISAGCSTESVSTGDTSSNQQSTGQENNQEKENNQETSQNSHVYSNKDYSQIYSIADEYKGAQVKLKGQVFLEPERDKDGTYFQMYADPEGMEFNTIVGIPDPDLSVKNGDFVEVEGTIKDMVEGENLVGGTLRLPVVMASSVKVTDYITAVSPTLKTIEAGKTIDQHGYQMTLEKIELADKETRVYMKIKNNSNNTISFYDFNAKAIQGNQQLDGGEMNFDADYPEVQSEILPGVESSGIVLFPPFDAEKPIKLIFEGSSDNWELDFEPFVFEVVKEK